MRAIQTYVKFFVIFLLVFVLGALFGYGINSDKTFVSETIPMEYGDNFNSLNLVNHNGVSINKEVLNSSKTIVFYLDIKCGSCLNMLDAAKRLGEIFPKELLNIVIVWKNKIPVEYIQSKNIALEINYTFMKSSIANATPTIYLLDKDLKVAFKCNTIEDLKKKLLSDFDISALDVKNIINTYLVEQFQNENISKKPLLIYFYMEGCSDCKGADEILKNIKANEYFDIHKIVRYNDDKFQQDEILADYNDIISDFYNIQWYPSFLLFNGKDFIHIEERNLENLRESLNTYIHS